MHVKCNASIPQLFHRSPSTTQCVLRTCCTCAAGFAFANLYSLADHTLASMCQRVQYFSFALFQPLLANAPIALTSCQCIPGYGVPGMTFHDLIRWLGSQQPMHTFFSLHRFRKLSMASALPQPCIAYTVAYRTAAAALFYALCTSLAAFCRTFSFRIRVHTSGMYTIPYSQDEPPVLCRLCRPPVSDTFDENIARSLSNNLLHALRYTCCILSVRASPGKSRTAIGSSFLVSRSVEDVSGNGGSRSSPSTPRSDALLFLPQRYIAYTEAALIYFLILVSLHLFEHVSSEFV